MASPNIDPVSVINPWPSCICRQVLSVYKERGWVFIEEHLHDVLGKQSREAGDLSASIHHFTAMLPCTHSPESWQAIYLRQFLDVVEQDSLQRVRHSIWGLSLSRVGKYPPLGFENLNFICSSYSHSMHLPLLMS